MPPLAHLIKFNLAPQFDQCQSCFLQDSIATNGAFVKRAPSFLPVRVGHEIIHADLSKSAKKRLPINLKNDYSSSGSNLKLQFNRFNAV